MKSCYSQNSTLDIDTFSPQKIDYSMHGLYNGSSTLKGHRSSPVLHGNSECEEASEIAAAGFNRMVMCISIAFPKCCSERLQSCTFSARISIGLSQNIPREVPGVVLILVTESVWLQRALSGKEKLVVTGSYQRFKVLCWWRCWRRSLKELNGCEIFNKSNKKGGFQRTIQQRCVGNTSQAIVVGCFLFEEGAARYMFFQLLVNREPVLMFP